MTNGLDLELQRVDAATGAVGARTKFQTILTSCVDQPDEPLTPDLVVDSAGFWYTGWAPFRAELTQDAPSFLFRVDAGNVSG